MFSSWKSIESADTKLEARQEFEECSPAKFNDDSF